MPPRTVALAPLPGHPVPRPPLTTVSAMAPRRPPMAQVVATPGVPRPPPTASQHLPRAPAAPTAGAIRLVQAADLARTMHPLLARLMRPRRAPVWEHLRPRHSTHRPLVRTRRLRLRPSARRRRVPGRAAGVPTPRLLRPWARRPLLPVAATMVHRRRLRTVGRRRRLLRRARFGTLMTIEGGGFLEGNWKVELLIEGSGRLV